MEDTGGSQAAANGEGKGATKERLASRRIYEQLRREIILGTLAPGVRLVLREISERYRTSMFPVREALRMLEQDGLVISIPHQGARVAELSREQIEDSYLIRGSLEGAATADAVPYLTKSDLKDLQRSLDRQRELAGEALHDQLAQENRRFHGLIFDACPNSSLRGLIDRMWSEQTKFRAVLGYEEGRELLMVRQHAQILDRLKAHDPHGASVAAREHRWSTAEALLAYMNRRDRMRIEIESM